MMIEARYDDGSAMSDAHIRDELRTLLIAGHETTAITLAWALYCVHRNPDVKRKLLAELDALGLGRHVPYAERRYELSANWKLVNDASLDSYHIRHGHRRTIASMFLDTMCVFDRFGFNRVLGRFESVTGELVLDEANPANSSVHAVIQVASVDSSNDTRDEHLRGALRRRHGAERDGQGHDQPARGDRCARDAAASARRG